MLWAVEVETGTEVRCYKLVANGRPQMINDPATTAGCVGPITAR